MVQTSCESDDMCDKSSLEALVCCRTAALKEAFMQTAQPGNTYRRVKAQQHPMNSFRQSRELVGRLQKVHLCMRKACLGAVEHVQALVAFHDCTKCQSKDACFMRSSKLCDFVWPWYNKPPCWYSFAQESCRRPLCIRSHPRNIAEATCMHGQCTHHLQTLQLLWQFVVEQQCIQIAMPVRMASQTFEMLHVAKRQLMQRVYCRQRA